MKYSLYCVLFGHKFKALARSYTPAYLKQAEMGLVSLTATQDYHVVTQPIDFCIRCGLTKKEVGII